MIAEGKHRPVRDQRGPGGKSRRLSANSECALPCGKTHLAYNPHRLAGRRKTCGIGGKQAPPPEVSGLSGKSDRSRRRIHPDRPAKRYGLSVKTKGTGIGDECAVRAAGLLLSSARQQHLKVSNGSQ